MNVSVYQICYDLNQHASVDPAFIMYDNSRYCDMYTKLDNPREYQVFLDNHETVADGYTGYVSWKFNSKTGLAGEQVVNMINTSVERPDVYFINCGPRSISNVWRQGEKQHPGIVELTQSIFDSLADSDERYGLDIHNMYHDKSKTAFCNFWIGNKTFWKKYINFTTPIYNYIQQSLTESQKNFMKQRACKGINSNYFPFIMERLFTTLLHVDDSITYRNVPRIKA